MKPNFSSAAACGYLRLVFCQQRGPQKWKCMQPIKSQDGHIVQRRRACVLIGTGKRVQLIQKCLHKQMMGKKKTQLERGHESSGMNHPHQPYSSASQARAQIMSEELHTWTVYTKGKVMMQMDRPPCPLPPTPRKWQSFSCFSGIQHPCFPFKRGQNGRVNLQTG